MILKKQFTPPHFYRQSPHIYWFFVNPPLPLKTRIFTWTPKILKFFILHTILSFRSLEITKFLVKIFQFEFLVMKEPSILVYKLFLLLNIPNFNFRIFQHFLSKNCNPFPEKSHPLFSSNPSLWKLKSCQAPSFWKLGARFNSPSRKGGRGVAYC